MRLLLDQGLPRSAVGLLAAANIDAVHVADLGLSSAGDSVILDVARKEARIVVTLDADFHNQLAVSGLTSPSVIRIRIERLRGEELASLVLQIIQRCQQDLDAGAMIRRRRAAVFTGASIGVAPDGGITGLGVASSV